MKPYYEQPGITIYHADCRELPDDLLRADLLLTDPPYGIRAASSMAARSGYQPPKGGAAKSAFFDSDWDSDSPGPEVLGRLVALAKSAIVWGGNYHALPPTRSWLVWDKQINAPSYSQGELAWTNLAIPLQIKRHMWNGFIRAGSEARVGHPTQKPLDLMTWCIGLAGEPTSSVVDPYMGSGTTVLAAKNLGLSVVGVEIEERYCEMAVQRLAQGVLAL